MFSFSNFSATSAMTAAAAGIFVGIIAPLTGGLPKPYELQEFRASFTAFVNGQTSAASGPAFYPNRNALDLTPTAAAQEAEFIPSALPEPLTLDGEVIEVAQLPEATTIADGEIVPVVQMLTTDTEEALIIEAPQADESKEAEGYPS